MGSFPVLGEVVMMARYKIDCCTPGCPGRSGDCHATCKEYKQQRQEMDETKEEQQKKEAIKRGLNEYKFDFGHKVSKRDVYRSKYRRLK